MNISIYMHSSKCKVIIGFQALPNILNDDFEIYNTIYETVSLLLPQLVNK